MPMNDLNFPAIVKQIETQIHLKENEYLLATGIPFLPQPKFHEKLEEKAAREKTLLNPQILNLNLPFFMNVEVYITAKDLSTQCVWFTTLENTKGFCHGELVSVNSGLNSTHRHDFFEFTYVYQGYCAVNIQDKKHIFRQGEIYLLDLNCEHRDLRDESDGIIIYMGVQPEVFNNFILKSMDKNSWRTFLQGNLARKQSNSYISKTLSKAESEIIEEYLAHIYCEINNGKKGYLQMMQVYLMRMLDELGKNDTGKISVFDSKTRSDMLFLSVSEYIETHIDDVDLHKLTEKFHYQKDYYNRLIKEYTGFTFSEYLRRIRLDKAKKLLNLTELSVKEIAHMLGYSNESYLFRLFKEEMHLTPLEYREKNNKET